MLNLLFSRQCCGCGRDLAHSFNKFLCFCCWKQIPLTKGICLLCGCSHGKINVAGCYFCKKNVVREMRYVGKYEDLLKQLLLQYKFFQKIHYFHLFVALLHRSIIKFPFSEKIDYVIPIPLTIKKRIIRGFDQVSLISDGIARKLGVDHMDDNLVKVRWTKNQTQLPRIQRQKNLQGAFALRMPQSLANKNILLIDDIYTTGSTVKEASTTLKKQGKARKVFVAVIAR